VLGVVIEVTLFALFCWDLFISVIWIFLVPSSLWNTVLLTHYDTPPVHVIYTLSFVVFHFVGGS